jgi:3-methyladenine DNA glycosylase AlkD
MNRRESIVHLQRLLAAASSEKTKLWWEKYLRGAAAFRGVGIPEIRRILAEWRDETGVASLPLASQLDLAFALFEEPLTEDKLAGVLFLQDYLRSAFRWQDLLPRYAQLYERNWIFDWNTCDWFCVRVLSPTLKESGLPFARALARWRTAPHLWQARSAAVPFISVAGDPAFYPLIHSVCDALIQRPERFAKTAVGWLLREVSHHNQGFVLDVIRSQAARFSSESAGNALKYFATSKRADLLIQVKRTADQSMSS